MIARGLGGLIVVAFAATAASVSAKPPRTTPPRGGDAAADSFPHARHARLFTSCTACHAGIPTGDTATARPSPELCAGCHDGSLVRPVTWGPGPLRPTNLRFDHRRHAGRVPLPCATCHASALDAPLMDVGAARPDRCLMCHRQGEAGHLDQASCDRCHVPLAQAARLAASVVARLPKPPSHDSTWVLGHPSQASSAVCATCHTRDLCASCHVNAATVEEIRNLPGDARVAALVRNRRVTYPTPEFHRADGFFRAHGFMAEADVRSCSNCHARESCLGCHRAEERVSPIAALPRRMRGGAFGVDLSGVRPPDHGPDHLTRHRVPAAGGDATCSRCHAATFCASCHDASVALRFHSADFVERHSQDAYTRENDCAACHQTEAFCRNCHRLTGQSRTRAAFGRFHDNQPLWVFGHGGVARRAIESCASCHEQRDCLRCHSASLGWKVNPHGRGFDPAVGDRNPAMCRTCHLNGPPNR